MNRTLAAVLAAASCATVAQAQTGPAAPTASAGLTYTLDVGEGLSATLAGSTMAIVEAGGRTRLCRKEGSN